MDDKELLFDGIELFTPSQFSWCFRIIGQEHRWIHCGLKKGETVELSPVMGNGFDIDQIDPPEEYPTVFIFATGSGIRWYEENKLNECNVSRSELLECYYLATATIFDSERSHERMVWAKSSVLVKAIFSSFGESSDSRRSFFY